jgi:hypothetical protein
VAAALKPAQRHDRQEMARMQAVRRGIEPDVGGNRTARQLIVEGREIGALMDEAACGERLQKGGSRVVIGVSRGLRKPQPGDRSRIRKRRRMRRHGSSGHNQTQPPYGDGV